MESFDFRSLEDELLRLSLRTLAIFAETHRDETFYAFSVDTDTYYGSFGLCLATENDIESAYAKYRQRFPDGSGVPAGVGAPFRGDIGKRYIDDLLRAPEGEPPAGWSQHDIGVAEFKLNPGDWNLMFFNATQKRNDDGTITAKYIDDALWNQWEEVQRRPLRHYDRTCEALSETEISLFGRDWFPRITRAFCRTLFRIEQSGALEALRREPYFVTFFTDHDVALAECIRTTARERAIFAASHQA